LWWRPYPNPTRWQANAFAALRTAARRVRRPLADAPRPSAGSETLSQKAVRLLAHKLIAPQWTRHLAAILESEHDVQAVLLISVPPNHLRGVAGAIRARFKIPVLFYDGDVPASLPTHPGFATGVAFYPGSDLQEFDAVLSNSKGGEPALQSLGARRVHTLYYGADPDVYQPVAAPQDIDVFFYGHTMEYRREWIRAMITAPRAALPEARFAVRGVHLEAGADVEVLPYRTFSDLRRCIARSKVNLVIVRQPQASLYGSSTLRPFELAMMGACMVSNPYLGIEEWFEPGRELIVVSSAEEAADRYRFLLSHEAERRALGEAARRRALAEHTYRHRAARLIEIIREHV
jgi:spore maturation protein CgeB